MTIKTFDPDIGDMERAAELIEHFILDGDDSDAYKATLAHTLAEFDVATIVTAAIALAAGARSHLEHDPVEVVRSMWRVVAGLHGHMPDQRGIVAVLDEIERGE